MQATGGAGPARVRGAIKINYSARELLKAPAPSESPINMILWYRLVGVRSRAALTK